MSSTPDMGRDSESPNVPGQYWKAERLMEKSVWEAVY